MAINKKEAFLPAEQAISSFAKALAHPARLAILKVLASKKECVCGELVELLPLAQSTVSQHLKELKEAGLIKGTIDGPKSCYCINWKNLQEGLQELNQLFQSLQLDQDSICCN